MEGGSELFRPIWNVCSDKIARCVGNAGIETDRNENVTKLLNVCLMLEVEILVDLVKERRLDQGFALSFRSVHLSVSKSGFVAGRNTSCVKNYVRRVTLSVIERS